MANKKAEYIISYYPTYETYLISIFQVCKLVKGFKECQQEISKLKKKYGKYSNIECSKVTSSSKWIADKLREAKDNELTCPQLIE